MTALVRDAAGIVVVGVALGLAFNAAGLSSRPPRGLPWIASEAQLDSLGARDAPLAAGDPLPVLAPPLSRTNVTETPHMRSAAPDPPREPAPPAVDPGPPPAEAQPPAPIQENLPAIPDVARPLRVGLPPVQAFVGAGAALLVDARDRASFAAGHIPGAISVPYEDAAQAPPRPNEIEANGRPIIVYCGGGDCEASAMLAEILIRDLQLHRVLVYEGGFPEWAGSGMPVSRGTP